MFCLLMAGKSYIHPFFFCSVPLLSKQIDLFIWKYQFYSKFVFSLIIQRSLQPVSKVYIDSSEEKNKQIAAIKYGVF